MKLKWIAKDTDRHGNERIYVRKPGCAKQRLHAVPGTEAFMQEYFAAIQASKPAGSEPSSGSLHSLFSRYFAECGEYKRLERGTKQQIKSRLERLCLSKDALGRERGAKPFAGIESQHVIVMRDAFAETVTVANALLYDMRGVWEWAKKMKLVRSNPCNEVSPIPYVSDGYHTWTVEEIRQYESKWTIGTKARLAFDLLLYTGVRRSDVVKLTHPKDGLIRWTETKGRKKVVKQRSLPVLPQLAASIAASPTGAIVLLTTAYGLPFTPAGFSNWFKDRCVDAGLPHCSAHGLRKAGATIAAERGATGKQLQAIYGWTKLATAEVYVKKADEHKLAAQALHLVAPEENENTGVPQKDSGTK